MNRSPRTPARCANASSDSERRRSDPGCRCRCGWCAGGGRGGRGGGGGQDNGEGPIIGDPIGVDGLKADLVHEMIPYTPEELIAIAEQ